MIQCAHCRRYLLPNERKCSAMDCKQVASVVKGNVYDLIRDTVRFHQLRVHGLCFCGSPGTEKHGVCRKHAFGREDSGA